MPLYTLILIVATGNGVSTTALPGAYTREACVAQADWVRENKFYTPYSGRTDIESLCVVRGDTSK